MANWVTRLFRPERRWAFGGGSGWFSTSSQVPKWPGVVVSASGSAVTVGTAVGLPAVAAAIRLLAETTGMVPLVVYKGDSEAREKARESWQWYRLHDQPNDQQSAFDFFQDVETSIETHGNAFAWKAKARPVIQDEEDIQLFVLDPSIVRATRENGRKVFKVREDGVEKTYSSSQIIHIRGWALTPGADEGISPIALHRESLGAAIAREQHEGAFYQNHAQPSLAIVAPKDSHVTDEEANQEVDLFVQQHTGVNAFRPAFIRSGGDIKALGIPNRDAQFIESKMFSVEDVARIFHITAVGMLKQRTEGVGDTKSDFERFLKVDLAPRLRRIELALKADKDLFGGDGLFPEFLSDAVLKPDIQSRYAAYKDARQGGWLEANEIREKENYPHHPDGDGLQQTPVGGAPNA